MERSSQIKIEVLHMDEEQIDELSVEKILEEFSVGEELPEEVEALPEELPAETPPKKKKRKWVRVLMIILLTLLGLVLAFAIYVGIWIYRLVNMPNYQTESEYTMSSEEVESIHQEDSENQTMSPEEETDPDIPNLEDIENQFTTAPSETVTAPEPSIPDSGSSETQFTSDPSEPVTEPEPTDPPVPMGDIVNILLIGQDRRPGEKRARSDSMILVTFNKTTEEITLTSFMRDSYVQIPGYKPHKLCHAHQYGGMSLLNETLYVNYGVEVDGDISVDFSQFEEIIDYLGGVDIKVTQKEADYMNKVYAWSMEPGYQRLSGKEALAYSRIRYIDSDYRRASRQRNVLMSLIERYKSLSIPEMLDMLEEVLPMITTNIDKDDVIPLALELFPMLATYEFNTQQIPAEGTFKGGEVRVRPGLKNWFQYNIDFEENRRILREIFDAE